MLLVHRALQRLDGILVSVSSVSVSPERGDSLEAVSRLFSGFYLKFFCERFLLLGVAGLSLVAGSRRLSPVTLTKIAGYFSLEMTPKV